MFLAAPCLLEGAQPRQSKRSSLSVKRKKVAAGSDNHFTSAGKAAGRSGKALVGGAGGFGKNMGKTGKELGLGAGKVGKDVGRGVKHVFARG